ncbi:hypothetical protein NST84_29940 [Paenibacillus sp. FSL R7-0345]|uniref:hypothetical protein n=1 Tax=Paenibacillus sp. FSL R7-0345 TaxID=2954535 RepID=UPI00315A64D7
MNQITCKTDLYHIGGKLAAPYLGVAKRELSQLLDMLDSESTNPDFRIDSAGYRIVCLEHKEPDAELASVSLSAPFQQVEYVELCEVYKMQFYRMLLMHDNECFTIVLSPKEAQNVGLETWLHEQCGQESDLR